METEIKRIKAKTRVISARIDVKIAGLKEQVRLLSRVK